MKVLLVSSEVTPFAKTGGLADVAYALPVALAGLGMDVRVVMPGYSTNRYTQPPHDILPYMDVQLGSYSHVASVSQSTLPASNVPVYFINNAELFNRAGLYHENGTDYPDNARRFAFFCKAIIWMSKGLDWIPDIIHCNDWQIGLLPAMLRTLPDMKNDPELRRVRTLFTIHNMAYQGHFPPDTVRELGLSPEEFHPNGLEFYGKLNLMKSGLVYSDGLSTVSPTYAQEIQTPELGCALDGVLRLRANDLQGILNGIDYEEWNPETDRHLPANFSMHNLSGKATCKASLQQELSLAADPAIPLMVMISRLDPQKGFDILLPLIETLMTRDVQLAVLGTGLAEYHKALEDTARRYPGKMAVRLQFDNGLAHRMEAGGDIFLMPSRYEPCGLNQMYSMHYGTVPVVHRTGGLADSVTQFFPEDPQGTGFVFNDYSSDELLRSIDEALTLYAEPATWRKIQHNGMRHDLSWSASARLYAQHYTALANR